MSSVPEMKVTQTVEALAFLAKHGDVTLRVDEDEDHAGPFVRTPEGAYGGGDIPTSVASALAGWVRARVGELEKARRILALFGSNWTGFGASVHENAERELVKRILGESATAPDAVVAYEVKAIGIRPSSHGLNPAYHVADVNVIADARGTPLEHRERGYESNTYHVPLTPAQRSRVNEGYRIRVIVEVFK